MTFGSGAVGAYDRQALTHVALDELDLEALRAYVEQRLPGRLEAGDETLESLAARLGLLARSGPNTVPTVAGLLLFGDLPQLVHPHWGVAAARFAGTAVSDPVRVRRDLEGDLASLLEASLAFVETHSRTVDEQLVPGHPGVREVAAEYPAVAVRELMLNALVHRDLRSSGRVALRIFDDRLELWSPGGVPAAALDLELLAHEGGMSLPRNVVLAGHARALGLGEQLGRGLALARRIVAGQSHFELSIESDGHGVLVTLPSGLMTPAGRGS